MQPKSVCFGFLPIISEFVLSRHTYTVVQAFRLQLALQTGQNEATGPCMLDERLHVKPHHQPILFVDDSQAPNVQLFAAPMIHAQPSDHIPASHAAMSQLPISASPVQSMPQGLGSVQNPRVQSHGSLVEAESISGTPSAAARGLIHRLLSHGKGHKTGYNPMTPHSDMRSPSSASFSSLGSEHSVTALLRQASSKSSTSRMHPDGPSHGSDSRFAAMKSLTRHAISLDSPKTLATTRRHGTLIPRRALAPGQDTHTGSDVALGGYDFDMGGQLSRASSMGGSGASSFTEAHSAHVAHTTGLAHLHSAPPVTSRDNSNAADIGEEIYAAFNSSLQSAEEFALPSAPLDTNMQEDSSEKQPISSATDSMPAVADSSNHFQAVDSHPAFSALQQSVTPPLRSVSGSVLQRAAAKLAETEVAQSASADPLMLPLSQDSLEFSLIDPSGLLEMQDAQSRPLLEPVADQTSLYAFDDRQQSSLPPEEGSFGQLSSGPDTPLLQPLIPESSSDEQNQQQFEPTSSLAEQNLQLLQHLTPASSSAQQDRQLLQHSAPASSSAEEGEQLMQQSPQQPSLVDLDQQLLEQPTHFSSALQEGQPHQQPPPHSSSPAVAALQLPQQPMHASNPEHTLVADPLTLEQASISSEVPIAFQDTQDPAGLSADAMLSISSWSSRPLLQAASEHGSQPLLLSAVSSSGQQTPNSEAVARAAAAADALCCSSGGHGDAVITEAAPLSGDSSSNRLINPPEERQQVRS